MDDLKHKILSLINKQSPKIPSMGFSDSNYHFGQIETLSINSKTVSESDRPSDQDILESIEAAYFSTRKDFDICRFELAKLPDCLDCDQIQRDFKNLKQQHQVVSKKVLQLILEHQNGCNEEFKHVLGVLEEVGKALELCRGSRSSLGVAGKQFSASLVILANYRRRRLAQNLLDNLKMIRNLHTFEKRFQQLMTNEDFLGAIQELKMCFNVAQKYQHFRCVAVLTNKLQETIENTDGQLDRVLAQICFHFDADRYCKLQMAYNLLEKSQISIIDNLHVHYITAIYNSSFNVVNSYVTTMENVDNNDTNGKNPYKTLCQSINHDFFIPCLIHLCKVLFKIVLSYYKLVKWHNNDIENNEQATIEMTLNKQKLEHNLMKIWDDVQRKVSSLLLNANLAMYKFDQFVQVLSVVYRLIQVGEQFCGSKCEDLQESVRKQSINYFKCYHLQRLEELKIFLENEIWEICPVKSTFNILQLQEFKSLRSSLRTFRTSQTYIPNATLTDCSSANSQDGSSVTINTNYFTKYSEHGTPFDCDFNNKPITEEDILNNTDLDVNNKENASGYYSDEESEEDEELKKDFIDEDNENEENSKSTQLALIKGNKLIIITNTTLSVLRQMGKYLQMSKLLKSIAYQIICCMNQLFDFYLFSVHSFFISDLTIASSSLYSQELSQTLKKITDNMIITDNYNNDNSILNETLQINENNGDDNENVVVNNNKITKPNLSILVDLCKPEKLHGLSERIVAVESLVFLAKQFELLKEFFEFLIPNNNRIMLQQFFTQNIASAPDLRRPIYMAVVSQAFDLRQILMQMSKINWEIKDVMSQHNAYIDLILRQVQIFTLRLEDVLQKIPVTQDVYNALWESIAHIITHTLVQGFSEARKCSNGGRALMQLDFTQFLTKFEKISGLRPVPHRAYVENYVKAFYLPDLELEKWIRVHYGEYSAKHLFGLVSCAYQNNKKTKQRLLQIIEEMEKGTNNNNDR